MATRTSSIGAGLHPDDLYDDPYPVFAQMRAQEPVCWLPSMRRYLVTRYDDVVAVERQPEIFRAEEEGSLMTKVMGHTMLRKDDEAHARERRALEGALRPRQVARRWSARFEQNTRKLIADLRERGRADLFTDFAGPLAARNLRDLLGLRDVSDVDLQRWSQSMIDGGGSNYGDHDAVWEAAMAAAAAVDEAVEVATDYAKDHPDDSVISTMLHSEENLTPDEIRANVKVFIGGGLNEPRDSMLTASWAVLSDASVQQRLAADPSIWKDVFEESVRWIAPIGMYPRQLAGPVEMGGVQLVAGDKIGVCLGSANRDEKVFDRPDEFLLDRPRTPHVAFGGGPHYCLGTWVARSQVAQIALPMLFDLLPSMALDPEAPVRVGGWVFRGPLSVPVTWAA